MRKKVYLKSKINNLNSKLLIIIIELFIVIFLLDKKIKKLDLYIIFEKIER